ncbi:MULTISPECIES: hypothetical protein [unclassified Duganella]|uniref:hypothetical protein n=1 Tax=unclassified Duganella TaxID=2636909 RepID=UPI0011135968|nr:MULTISPECIES: hypothetical protein [unclassified Duganella]
MESEIAKFTLGVGSGGHLRARKVGAVALPTVSVDVAHENTLRLLQLIEHDSGEQVMRGELLRQLGRFDEAVAVLKAVEPDGYSETRASKVQRLAQAQISDLSILN